MLSVSRFGNKEAIHHLSLYLGSTPYNASFPESVTLLLPYTFALSEILVEVVNALQFIDKFLIFVSTKLSSILSPLILPAELISILATSGR